MKLPLLRYKSLHVARQEEDETRRANRLTVLLLLVLAVGLVLLLWAVRDAGGWSALWR